MQFEERRTAVINLFTCLAIMHNRLTERAQVSGFDFSAAIQELHSLPAPFFDCDLWREFDDLSSRWFEDCDTVEIFGDVFQNALEEVGISIASAVIDRIPFYVEEARSWGQSAPEPTSTILDWSDMMNCVADSF